MKRLSKEAMRRKALSFQVIERQAIMSYMYPDWCFWHITEYTLAQIQKATIKQPQQIYSLMYHDMQHSRKLCLLQWVALTPDSLMNHSSETEHGRLIISISSIFIAPKREYLTIWHQSYIHYLSWKIIRNWRRCKNVVLFFVWDFYVINTSSPTHTTGVFKNVNELLNLRVLKAPLRTDCTSFKVWASYFALFIWICLRL